MRRGHLEQGGTRPDGRRPVARVLRARVCAGSGRASFALEQVVGAAVSAAAEPALVLGKVRPDRRRPAHRAFLDRLGTPPRIRGRNRPRPGVRRGGRGRAAGARGVRARAQAHRGEAARRGERELLLVRAVSGKNARGALAARVRLHDPKRPHDGRSPAGAVAEIHGERRGAKAGRKVIPGVLDSRLRPEPDMDLATKEQSSSSAISELQRHLQDGSFVVTAELSPPVSTDPAEFIDHALALRGLVTAINVTDGAGSKAHMSSLAAAHFLVRSGVEPVLQITCRDRNRIALQAELLGAAALGIRNILALRGDDPTLGDQPDTKPVFDLDTTALLATAQRMRSEHRLPSGTEIKGAVRFVLGAAELPVDPSAGWRPNGLLSKMAAGAEFIQTQFCMDGDAVRRYAARLLELGVAQKLPILIGIAPIPSARSARWMKEKLFGAMIPDRIVDRLERAADPKAEGRRICVELLQQLVETPGVAGAHVMAPAFHSAIGPVIEASRVAGTKRARARRG